MSIFIRTLADIKQLIVDGGHKFDLHIHNLMMRGDQLVILDPISNLHDIDANEDFQAFDWQVIRGEPVTGKPARTTRSSSNQQGTDKGAV
jgi:hypothetical protein